MRAHRVVVVSAALLSVVSTVHARPRIPIFRAVLGAVGGVMGLRYYHHHHHHHAIAAREHAGRVAARTREETEPKTGSKAEQQPSVESNAARSGELAAHVFWPHLPEDLADYLLRPSGTDDAFWSYGYAEVLDGAFGPLSSRPQRTSARPDRRSTTAVESAAGGANGTCPGQQGAALADGLVERLEQTIGPSESQKSALEQLRGDARHGFGYFDASCRSDQQQSPTSRLDAMEDRIWAARQALLILRAPIDKLYASLNDEQKARFNGPAAPPQQHEATCANTTPELPLAQLGLGRGVRPAGDQGAGVEALKATSAGLARTVSATCPAGMPATPVGRLDLADKRLNALLYAVVTLRAPLDAFYASLNRAPKSQPTASR